MSSVFSMISMIYEVSDIRAEREAQKERVAICQAEHRKACDAFIASHFGKTINLADAKAIKEWLRTAVPTLPVDGPNTWTPLGLARQPALQWWEAIMPINPMLTLAPPEGAALEALLKISGAESDERARIARENGWSTRASHVGRRSFTRL